MLGKMQHEELLISSLIDHAARSHPDVEIVSRTSEGAIHRSTYGEVELRARRLAAALTRLGVGTGERVGTLAWNGYRHMELYYGVSGMGAVLHTINPRLFPEQIDYIVNHAEDQFLFFDIGFAPLVEELAPRLPNVKAFVAMTDRAHMPPAAIRDLLCYEDLLTPEDDGYAWPPLFEDMAAALCYTSGTTGNPKGVLYSHRSSVLHAFAACAADGLAVSRADTVLPVVPMFHVNAWGIPYAGAMSGAKLVFPGPRMDGAAIYELLRDEKVTLALGVPSVWLMLLQHIEAASLAAREELRLARVVIGGSAAPESMIRAFDEVCGASVVHAWGMTELSPIGAVCRLLPKHDALPDGEKRRIQCTQGRAPFGMTLKITGEDGRELPRDGKTSGNLKVRGHWVTGGYFGQDGEEALDADGWFDTGDVATVDPDGYLHITDRAKDVIKSGGEWISSIDLENAACGHPAVGEAAVIGIAHPKWQERPLLIVVPKPGRRVSGAELLDYLSGKVAKWWLPDDVQFVERLPRTATGKIQKVELRKIFNDYRFPPS
jgi:fatty-acyl-CoA synthase